MGFWRIYGCFANSRVGRYLLERDRGLLAAGAATMARVDLETEVPWTPLQRPVRECRVALITTAGVHRADQPPFDVDAALGDPSFRVIPGDQDLDALAIAHTHYPNERARRDVNVVFPLGRLREAAERGGIGEVAPHHVSFGFCALTKELVKSPDGSAHQVAALLVEDRVDLALLVPG